MLVIRWFVYAMAQLHKKDIEDTKYWTRQLAESNIAGRGTFSM